VTGGAVGLAGIGSVGAAGAESADAAVTFEDQTTDGTEVVIAAVSTSVDVTYNVATDGHEVTYARGELAAGEHTQLTVTLDRLLTQDRPLEVSLYPDEGGEALAMDGAQVDLAEGIEFVDGMDVTFVDADTDAGFNYPYYLYAPPVPTADAAGPILVEPNNTGTSTDDFRQHREAAREIAEGRGNGGSGRTISDRLGVPFLVPVFPRPRSEPVDWRHYVHQLDTETMQITEGDLARVDRQLIRMVEDARERLSTTAYDVRDGMLLNGFSASGNFVNRFAALHPDRVVSVTAGGINGTAILPISEAEGHTLNYQIGIADLESLTGEPFDLEAFRDVNQFLYMGALDWSDTIPYGDAWSEEQRAIALDVLGPNMQRDRMPHCQSVYEQRDVSAAFRIYDRAGHSPRPAIDDLVAFHRRSLAGGDVSGFGEDLGPDRQSTDVDDDGVFEDVDGDGSFTIADVQELIRLWATGG
jgi:hypothetical protein